MELGNVSGEVDFALVPGPGDGSHYSLSRLTDGRVMCCLCFGYFHRSDLNPVGDGAVEDVCRQCAEGEAATAATIEEMRAVHRSSPPEASMNFQLALQLLAHGYTEFGYARYAEFRWRSTPGWKTVRHDGCPRCSCPPKSVVMCLGCDVAIVSVHAEQEPICSGRCRQRAHRRLADALNPPTAAPGGSQ